jgi:hypothetical protein
MKTITAIVLATIMTSFALAAVAGGGSRTRECVYDYTFMTEHECRAYRMKVIKAKSEEERLALRRDLLRVLEARARERGTTTDDWRGLDTPPPATGATK